MVFLILLPLVAVVVVELLQHRQHLELKVATLYFLEQVLQQSLQLAVVMVEQVIQLVLRAEMVVPVVAVLIIMEALELPVRVITAQAVFHIPVVGVAVQVQPEAGQVLPQMVALVVLD